MTDIQLKKKKLEQRKAKMQLEETRLKLKERKMRTRNLIELGGLIAKAKLDHLPKATIYGALLSLQKQLNEDDAIQTEWQIIGDEAFLKEQDSTTPVILSFEHTPEKELKDIVRKLDLRFNRFRSEWYGNIKNIDELKSILDKKYIKYDLEILDK